MAPSNPEDTNLSQADESVQTTLAGIEQTLDQLQKQITVMQRLASLGTVSAMLAHEFNNVLTPIVSYCQYALTRDDPEMLRTAVDKTLRNALRLTTLCGKILGMTQDEHLGPTPTKVEPIVRDALSCLCRDLEKDNITLSVDVPEGLTASAHAASLQQVVFNLVLNARQAMLGTAGRLDIRGHRGDNGLVVLDITDNGCGIRPEHLPRIFEPFFSTKRHETRTDRSGVGLGLHICKRLMTEQEGDICVRSRPGEGTTFTLTLPAA